jgi:hypothetical protein
VLALDLQSGKRDERVREMKNAREREMGRAVPTSTSIIVD